MRKFKCIGRNTNFSEKYFIVKLGDKFYLLYQFIYTRESEKSKFSPVRFYEINRHKSYTLKGAISRLNRIFAKRNYTLLNENEVKNAFSF